MTSASRGGPERAVHSRIEGLERAVDWAQVRAVLWAQWRIGVRTMSSNKLVLVLSIVGWLMFVGFVIGGSAAAFLAAAYARSNPEWAARAVPMFHIAYLFVLVALAVSPALGLRGNEFLDVTKLFTYPVNHRTVFASSLLGLLVSKSVLFFALPLLAAVAGWSASVGEALGGGLVTLLLLLVAVALGQTGLLLFLDLFRSRKWRDLSRIVGALLGAGAYAAIRLVSGRILREQGDQALQAVDHWKNWASPLPSWWAAHAVTGTGALRWLPAIGLPVVLFWLVVAAARLQERAYFGEIEERRGTTSESGTGFAGWVGGHFRGVLAALVEKDLRILARDPTVRILVIQQLAFSVLPLVVVFLDRSGSGRAGGVMREGVFAFIPYVPVLASFGLTLNPLGLEGPGLQHVLCTPAPRGRIVLAKLMALTIVVGGTLAALVGVGTWVLAWLAAGDTMPAALGRGALTFVEAICAFAVLSGIGGVVGAFMPSRVVFRARRALRQTSGGHGGCARGIASFAALSGGALACGPVWLALHHPMLFHLVERDTRPFLAATIPFAILYSGLALWAGAALGGRTLERREEQALDVLTRSTE